MSLSGLTIAITASRRASELARLVENFNGKPYVAPTIGIEANLQRPNKVITEFIDRMANQNVDYAVFMTGPGVFSLMSIAQSSGMEDKLIEALEKVIVVARSIKPQMALKKYGIKTDLIPEENTAKGILMLLKNKGVFGKTIAILWHGDYSRGLKDELYTAGATNIIEASTYKYSFELEKDGARILQSMGFKYIAPHEQKVVKLIKDIADGNINVITFTSPPSARDLFKIADIHHLSELLRHSLNKDVIVAVVGPSTKAALEENGVNVDVMPQIFKMGSMIKALTDYVSQINILKGNNNKKPVKNV